MDENQRQEPVRVSSELWRDCAAWLTRCKVLRSDHKANWPAATIHDLVYTLRDGVLLCNLLNTLDQGCIDMREVNQKPQMAQFLCLRNIKTFLQTCQGIFDLTENDLFEPPMLFDLSDLFRVFSTLSKLSNCPKVQKTNISGFSVHKLSSVSQEDIYRNLNSSDERFDERKEEVEYGSYYSMIKNEEIYQDLCALGRKSHQSQPAEKRDFVINELVETEKNYVDVLATVQRNFLRPLSNVLPEEDMKIIFFGFKDLSEIHSGFHSQLRKACSPNTTLKLSEAFLNWHKKFLIYGDYCANLPVAQDRIQELCRTKQLINQEVMKCQDEANNGKFKLRDILSVPMQRILKYHLLLDKLYSETPQTHEDYRGLERAREAMVDVAEYINEVKRDSDTLQIINDIQESISDWDMPVNTELKDYGRLLLDGELKIKAHDDQKTRTRYVFVFDKVMLMCKSRGDIYSFRHSLRLTEYKVEDTISRRVLNQGARWTYQFFLVRKSERMAYTLYARTEELKKKWINAIKEALDNIEPAACRETDHNFAMETYDQPTTCDICSKYLKGRIFQGYKCCKCMRNVHKDCIIHSGPCGRPPLPPRPGPETRLQNPEHSSLGGDFKDYLWFVGEMDRDRATALLDMKENGTYLVRIRPQEPTRSNETRYALSLKTDDKVKHMKVNGKEIDGQMQFYLSESRYFKSIVELVNCYEQHSLNESFSGLNEMLQWPYRSLLAVAKFNFNPGEPNQLRLTKGCTVVVVSKEGDQKGWWKGKVNNEVGFFPKHYVSLVTEVGARSMSGD